MKTATQKERERKGILRTQEEYRRHYEALPKYELEYIGGPYAGKMIHCGVNNYTDGCYVEFQGTWDEQGRTVVPCFVYRYKNGAFHYLDQSKKPPPKKECPTCGGRGYLRDEPDS